MVKRMVIALLVLMLGGALRAQTETPQLESLTYSGYYNWGIIWMRAGSIAITTTKSDKYPDALKLEAVGMTLPSWDWMFKIRDTLVSHFNEKTFFPYEFARMAHEGSYHKTFEYVWDYEKEQIYSTIEKIGRYRRLDSIALEPNTFDMLSLAWLARDLDFETYQVKDQIPIRLLIDDEILDLYVRYLGTDKVKVGGKKRESYVFAPLLVEGDVFKGGEGMKIWVSKDEYRIPLQVEAKILVGSVKAILEPSKSKYREK